MKKTLIVLAVVIIALVALFYAFNSYIYREKQGTGDVTEPYRATLTGTEVCLPHKDTSGPQTKECALGMKTDTGEYYALDFGLMSSTTPDIRNGERFTASGVITPVERLSSDQWQKYAIEGIFSVTDSVVVHRDTSKDAAPDTAGKCYVGGCSSQLCTDQPNMASTCEYRDEYACYQTAVCERQTSGECGWTETAALTACLANPTR